MKKNSCTDLYSGIGGWTMGMKLSNIENHSSYEWFNQSNNTHNQNFNSKNDEVDIRKLKLTNLPKPGSIDFVVGSPPCTQFSFSNRGGSGDIDDGLVDVYKFLNIVSYLKPKYWVMENVPRVKNIINDIINNNKKFKKFKHLIKFNEVVDSSEFGLPQKRRRMICGDFPFEIFMNYRSNCEKLNMGDVIDSLKNETIVDPIYGYSLKKTDITDHIKEVPLNSEELRLNSESKIYHPIYNNMNFPDLLEKPSRTITSTCTRVSRESIIIKDDNRYRRLTLREKGMIQGFPITFQFFGNSFSSKQMMIGNSIPPVITYYLFQSMLEVKPNSVKKIREVNSYFHRVPDDNVKITHPEKNKGNYRKNRSFRLSIPGLRFGSGVRFELSNKLEKDKISWSIKFLYGSSKKIQSLDLGNKTISKFISENFLESQKDLTELNKTLKKTSSMKLQNVWNHLDIDSIHPYKLLDLFGDYVKFINEKIKKLDYDDSAVDRLFNGPYNKKLEENKSLVITGLLLGNFVNKNLKNEN